MTYTAAAIAEKIRGQVVGDGSVLLTGFTSADRAHAGDLTFAEKDSFFAAAEASQASAILVSGPFASRAKVIIRVADARVAAAKALELFFPADPVIPGIHASACIPLSPRL